MHCVMFSSLCQFSNLAIFGAKANARSTHMEYFGSKADSKTYINKPSMPRNLETFVCDGQ